jgi:beta-lactam-binding protein with PASTA domain
VKTKRERILWTLVFVGLLVLAFCVFAAIGWGDTKVPDVTGYNYTVARSLLASNDFKIVVRSALTHGIVAPERGMVVTGQFPPAGTRSHKNAHVTIFVEVKP